MLKIEEQKGIRFELLGRGTYVASVDFRKPHHSVVRTGKVDAGRLVYLEVRELETDLPHFQRTVN